MTRPPEPSTDQLPILVAVGEGPSPDSALELAVELCRREGRPLLLAHVAADPNEGAGRSGGLAGPTGAAIEAATRAAHLAQGRVAMHLISVSGSPQKELLLLSLSAFQVILRRRRLTPFHRLFTGSVSSHVAERAPVTVTVVPEFWISWPREPERVVAAVSRVSDEHLLAWAVREAAARGCPLDVVHVCPPQRGQAAGRAHLHAREPALRSALRRALDAAGLEHLGLKATVTITSGRPTRVLVDASRRADLLVLGRSGPPGHVGVLTRTLLQEAHCPVSIVPATALLPSRRPAPARAGARTAEEAG